MGDADAAFVKQLSYPQKLIVYQRFERRDIKHSDAHRHTLAKARDYREERRLRLAACGRGCQKQVVIRFKKGPCGGDLNRSQSLPRMGLYKFTNKIGKSFKYSVRFVHVCLLLPQNGEFILIYKLLYHVSKALSIKAPKMLSKTKSAPDIIGRGGDFGFLFF